MRLKTLAILAVLTLLLPAAAFAASENITHKTVTGEVIDLTEDSLRVSTDNGIFYFRLDAAQTQYDDDLSLGDLVQVDFNTGGEMDGTFLADEIRLQDRAESAVVTELDTGVETELETEVETAELPEPRPTMPLEPTPRAEVDVDEDVDEGAIVADLDADVDLDTDVPDVEELPRTGSALPLFGLVGALALALGLAIRFFV